MHEEMHDEVYNAIVKHHNVTPRMVIIYHDALEAKVLLAKGLIRTKDPTPKPDKDQYPNLPECRWPVKKGGRCYYCCYDGAGNETGCWGPYPCP